jgi:hypothetical protein
MAIALLGFLKAAGHQDTAKLPHEGSEDGGIDRLEA